MAGSGLPTCDTISEVLLARVPELREAYDFATFGDEVLVTIFLGEVASYVLEQVGQLAGASKTDAAAIELRIGGIAEIVEDALEFGNDELVGAISAGFLEELDTENAGLFRQVLERLGPHARHRIQERIEFYRSKEWRDFIAHLDRQGSR